MVNKCVVANCNSGFRYGPRKPSFLFPQNEDLRKRWIYFVNRQDWSPSKHSVICVDHFEERFIQYGRKCKLKWDLHPVPTIQTDVLSNPSLLRTPTVPRNSPRKRKHDYDELALFKKKDKVTDFNSFLSNHAPDNISFSRRDNTVQYYNLYFDVVTGIPAVHECISINQDLNVTLSYNGILLPLPEWFRKGTSCKLTKFSMLENLLSYIRNKGCDYNIILKELNEVQHYDPKGRPKYSSMIIRFALLLRYSSCQTYKMLLQQLPLPSLALLKKITSGGIEAINVAKLLLEKGSISSDCVLLVDEMYLEKAAQYHSGQFIGQDEDGNLYKGIVVFMIVSLKNSVPCVIKSCPEVTITGEWLKEQMDSCIINLKNAGFAVRAVITDDHSSNVCAFNSFHKQYDGDNKLYINHPCYENTIKTFLFFDIIHLVKNIRNNLLNRQKFVFPAFSFNMFRDTIEIPAGYISWKLFYEIYEKDENLQGNLRKAPKLTFKATHPGNNKQDVSLALAIFDPTTSAAIKSYFHGREDAANFLSCFYKLFVICNSKQQFNSSNILGHAAVQGDNKPLFMNALADWVEQWSKCPSFTLTKQTAHALITTLRSTACLITDLLNENYSYVLTSRFQSDPIERRFSKYRQMSGGRFLVSLREVNNSEKILAISSVLKEGVDFWKEAVTTKDKIDEVCENCIEELELLTTEILETELNEDSKEVAVVVAGYIAKKLREKQSCEECAGKLIAGQSSIENDNYLKTLSRGGLVTPSSALSEFVCQSFSILDFVSPSVLQFASNKNIRHVSERVLCHFISISPNFVCQEHKEWGMKRALRVVANIFYNNSQKIINDSVRKDQVKEFKKRQRQKRE